MLYTRKGDKGTTKTLRGDGRISKHGALTEALGTVDELNSFLGLCKVESDYDVVTIKEEKIRIKDLIESVQQNLFTIQAELAGADKILSQDKIEELESVVDSIEKQLPPITSFLVPGGTKSGSLYDLARTITRRAERRVVFVHEGEYPLGEYTLRYLNRLSSLFYALARYANYKAGKEEAKPEYK